MTKYENDYKKIQKKEIELVKKGINELERYFKSSLLVRKSLIDSELEIPPENFSPEHIHEHFIKQGLKIVSPYINNKTPMKREYLKKYSSEIRNIIYSAIEELVNYEPQNL